MAVSVSLSRVLSFILIATVVSIPRTAAAAPTISVTLASGRTFVAEVARSDARRLWLRFGIPTAAVLRPVLWSKVTRMEIDGEDVAADQMQARAAELALAAAQEAADDVPQPETFTPPPPPAAPSRQTLPARSLVIESFAANWDGDPELDGLEIRVHPIDEHGQEVAVNGTLEVILLADRPGRFPLRHRRTPREVRTDRIGRWVRRVDTGDFGWRGAVYRLPYQAIHPQFDPDSGPMGSVYARLSVPGQGTFQTTLTDIRTRPYSTHRDLRQQRGQNRFFQAERTGRNKPAT